MRRICNWSPLPGEWCHYDRDGQLRPNWWQDLWRWPIPDGERQLLPPWCLQDYFTKVKRWGAEGSYFTNITRSWGGKVWTPHLPPFLLLGCTQKKCLNYHPAFAVAYIQDNWHLTPFNSFFIPSSTRLCRWHFEFQKTGAQINAWQAGIDIRAAELFTPAARCCCCLSHNQSSSERLQVSNTLLIPHLEH